MCDKLNTMSTIPKRVLFILGTRPEAIKLAPLINQVNDMSEYEAVVCLTGQHRELLHQVLSFFKIEARFNLDVMKQAQDLFSLTTEILPKLKTIIIDEKFYTFNSKSEVFINNSKDGKLIKFNSTTNQNGKNKFVNLKLNILIMVIHLNFMIN